MRALLLILLFGVTSTSVSCGGEATAPGDESAGLSVVRVAGGLQLRNTTERPIAYTVFERQYLALVNFAACSDPSPDCLRLPPSASVVVPYAEIGGYTPGAREAVVFWWHLVRDDTGRYHADRIRSTVTKL